MIIECWDGDERRRKIGFLCGLRRRNECLKSGWWEIGGEWRKSEIAKEGEDWEKWGKGRKENQDIWGYA
jgi:hypothetical protein